MPWLFPRDVREVEREVRVIGDLAQKRASRFKMGMQPGRGAGWGGATVTRPDMREARLWAIRVLEKAAALIRHELDIRELGKEIEKAAAPPNLAGDPD